MLRVVTRPCKRPLVCHYRSLKGGFTKLQLLDINSVDWSLLSSFHDRTIFQTLPWLNFVAATHEAKPVVAALLESGVTAGFFTGWIVRKYGVRIMGSPFPGSATSYTGFNIQSGVSRARALEALTLFAFDNLGCLHLEVMDRHLSAEDGLGAGYSYSNFSSYEIDLTKDEDELLGAMDGACRRCIRKAGRAGITIEEAQDFAFADEYYAQLEDVFAKQRLVPTYPKRRVQALLEHLLPTGNLLLLRARDTGGKCIATGIFPALNDTFYFWGGASWRSGQILRPNEAIQWYAMRYWKERGIARYDMGGGGSYKEKYGCRPISVPWFRKSKYAILSRQRDNMKKLHKLLQRLLGRLRHSEGKTTMTPVTPEVDE